MVFGRFKNLFENPATPHSLDQAIERVETAEPGTDVPYGFGEDEKHRRINSLYEVAGLGLPLSPHADLLAAEDFQLRHNTQQVFDRLMVIYGLSCAAWGEPREAVIRWFSDNNLANCLSDWETETLHDGDALLDELEVSLESQWALMWALSLAPELKPLQPADRDLGLSLLPKLPVEGVPDSLRKKARLRSVEELANAYDLQYCLVASLAFAQDNGLETSQPIDADVMMARLYALDWLFTDGDWEDATDMV